MVQIDYIDAENVTVAVVKGNEVYDPATGQLYEQVTVPVDDLDAELKRAAKAAAKAAKAEG